VLSVTAEGDRNHALRLQGLLSGDDLARMASQIVVSGGAIREINRAHLELKEVFTRVMRV